MALFVLNDCRNEKVFTVFSVKEKEKKTFTAVFILRLHFLSRLFLAELSVMKDFLGDFLESSPFIFALFLSPSPVVSG